MSERLPYEEQLAQQLNDLPLPDENMAWADMKRRLDDDDDKGIIPIWLRGCGFWGLLAVILLAIGWWIVRPDKWWKKEQATENIKTTENEKSRTNTAIRLNTEDSGRNVEGPVQGKAGRKNTSITSSIDSLQIPANDQSTRSLQKKDEIVLKTINNIPTRNSKSNAKTPTLIQEDGKKQLKKKNERQVNDNVDRSVQRRGINKDEKKDIEIKNNPVNTGKDPGVATTTVPPNKKDSVVAPTLIDPVLKKDSISAAKTNEVKKDSSKPKSISFSAGLAMHQLVPIDGQKLNPYNSAGRKGSVADYIPSVVARMYKNDKWFLQLEFRYGAPQYSGDLLYEQKIKNDSIGTTPFTTITSSKLKKTFYHQLPFTFNYFISKDWSVGAGVVWNKFINAVSQQDVMRRNNSTQVIDSAGNKIITDKNDSVFKKSYFQAMFETQYRWRRFSLGAKYSFGLQPYIRFSLPGGVQGQERNKSLQVFLRYELWRSKPKK
jgi:hypothetical protein